MKKNKAKAIWKGSLKDGNGTMKTNNLNKDFAYNFSSRFENGKETNPEELIAAAHAGCFSMALSALLVEKGYSVESISTEVEIVLEKHDGGFMLTESNITTNAEVPEIDEGLFMVLAVDAKVNCPVSKALSTVKINMEAHLI